jgi:hypothetical protein
MHRCHHMPSFPLLEEGSRKGKSDKLQEEISAPL